MAPIAGHGSLRRLEARCRASHDAPEARHLQAIRLLAQGRTVLEVAGVLAFAPRWVEQLAAEQLAARDNASGPAALGDGRWATGGAATAARRAC